MIQKGGPAACSPTLPLSYPFHHYLLLQCILFCQVIDLTAAVQH